MSKEPTKVSAPGKSPGNKAKRKLTRAEKKQIAAVIRQAKGDGKAHTEHILRGYKLPACTGRRKDRHF